MGDDMKRTTLILAAFLMAGVLLAGCRFRSNGSTSQQQSGAQIGSQTDVQPTQANIQSPTAQTDVQSPTAQTGNQPGEAQLQQSADDVDKALNDLDSSLQSDDTMTDLEATLAPGNGYTSDSFNAADQALNGLTQDILSVPTPAVP